MRRAKRIKPGKAEASNVSRIRASAERSGFGYQIPPEPEFVAIYFDQQGCKDQAERFYQHYQNEGWKTTSGTDIRNWKVLAKDWIFDHRQHLKRQARLSKHQTII